MRSLIDFKTKNNNEYIYDYLSKRLYLNRSSEFANNINKEIKNNIGLNIFSQDIENNLLNLNHICIEVTEKCNLSCRYCVYGDYYKGNNNRGQKQLNLTNIDTFFSFLFSLWKKNKRLFYDPILISFYGGEPLMEFSLIKKIIDFLNKKIKELNLKLCFIYSISTNGILLNKDLRKFLYSVPIQLIISIDGNENNNQFRVNKKGKNSFDIVNRNIENIKIENLEYFSKFVSFNSVIHKENSVIETSNFFLNNYNKTPNFINLDSIDVKHNFQKKFQKKFINKDHFNPSSELSYIVKNYKLKKNVQGYRFFVFRYLADFIDRFTTYSNNPELNAIPKSYLPTGTCTPFQVKLYLTIEGSLLPCEKIDKSFYLAKIINNQLKIDYNKICKKYLKYISLMETNCEECYSIYNCNICIFQRFNYLSSNNMVCPNKMNYEGFKNYLSEIITIFEENPSLLKMTSNII